MEILMQRRVFFFFLRNLISRSTNGLVCVRTLHKTGGMLGLPALNDEPLQNIAIRPSALPVFDQQAPILASSNSPARSCVLQHYADQPMDSEIHSRSSGCLDRQQQYCTHEKDYLELWGREQPVR